MINGFENEIQIVKEFTNTINFNDLNDNLKEAILIINNYKIPSTFSARKYGGGNKADLSIIIDGAEFNISVKKGFGNSIHQEPLEDFIDYLEKYVEKNEVVFNDLRYYIWGDGTLHGDGLTSNRIPANKLKKEFPSIIENIQNYFDRHKIVLTKRFLIDGVVSKKKVDFLLYGSITKCIVISVNKLIELAATASKKPLSIGFLTFQAWNRNLNGLPDKEERRGQIQLKWGTLESDLKKIT